MSETNPALQQIEQDLRSDNLESRGAAMQDLLRQTRNNPGIHAFALPIFQRYLETEHDARTSILAGYGIEHIVGPERAREMWLRLLNASRADVALSVALTLTDPFYFPALRDVLRRRPEQQVRSAVIRALGRMRPPDALQPILEHLADPALRPAAVEALGELGDSRAIPYLEPLLSDETELPERDERGAILHVSHLVNDALRRLRAPGPLHTAPIRPILFYPDAHPNVVFGSHPPPLPARSRFRLIALAPLAAAAIEIPWVIAILFLQLFTTGTVAKSQAQVHILDVISMLPSAAGVFVGIIAITRLTKPRRVSEIVCLVLGFLACGMFLLWFGWELTH